MTTLPEPERTPTTDYAGARRWEVNVYQPLTDDPLAGQTARETATSILREQIRGEGYQILTESVSMREAQPIIAHDAGGFDPCAIGDLRCTGTIGTWVAVAAETHTDATEPLLSPEGPAVGGILTFLLPDATTRGGGGVRIRHGLGGPVTCYAHRPSGDRMGYHVALDLDASTEHLELLPGAASITVRADDPEGTS